MYAAAIRDQMRKTTCDLACALNPVRDHCLASAREAMLAASSLFAIAAHKLDDLRSSTPVPAGTGAAPTSPPLG
jgi:hypothetical protein